MKIAVVDDDRKCLNEIIQLCCDFGAKSGCPVEVVPFSSGEAFLEAFSGSGFSAVFMDVYMDGMDGIAAAMNMRQQDSRCILVFLTSSTEFMPEAFSCHAFEYITKPFSKDRIHQVLTDAMKVLPLQQPYIEVTSSRMPVRVFLDNIVSAVTDAHYLDITLLDGKKLRCRMTMASFMEKTGKDPRFILVNKGIAVNADCVLGFENNCCLLENGAQLPIRVRSRVKIQQAVRDYEFGKIRSRQRHGREEWL